MRCADLQILKQDRADLDWVNTSIKLFQHTSRKKESTDIETGLSSFFLFLQSDFLTRVAERKILNTLKPNVSVLSGNKLVLSGNKLVLGGNKMVLSGNKLVLSGNKLVLSGNKPRPLVLMYK